MIRDLSKFNKAGYVKGRNRLMQGLWFLSSYLFFQKYWFPSNFRPPLLRLFGAQVGSKVLIRHQVRIHWPWKLKIGNYVWIGEGAWILNLEQVDIGNSVCISQEAFICTGSHDVKSPTFDFNNKPIRISDEVWLCARSIILAGSEVPKGSVIPALTTFNGNMKK